MIIQDIGGGLGNQILMYVFARFMERRNPQQDLVFDDTFYSLYGKVLCEERLENIFGIKLNFLSRYFEQDIWENILSLQKKQPLLPQVPRYFYDAGISMVMLTAREKMFAGFFPGITVFPDQLTPDMWHFPYKNLYCQYGWWDVDDWFKQDREENRKELKFPPLTDTKNLQYEEQIRKCEMPVGIHIRMRFRRENTLCLIERYRLACQNVINEFPNACFFVFSDELDWCKANAVELGLDLASCTVYIEGNNGDKDYIDMQLMGMCRGLIRPLVSTFSMAAGWLAEDLKFEIKLMENT